MKKLSKIAAILLALVLLFSLAACGTPAEESTDHPSNQPSGSVESDVPSEDAVEITFWHSYSEGEEEILTNTVLAAFAVQHPSIKVNAIRMPYEGLDQQLITAVSGDAAPDVMRMDLTWVSQMASLGALEQLDSYEGFDALAANIMEGSLNTTLYDGGHYGLPLNANTTVA